MSLAADLSHAFPHINKDALTVSLNRDGEKLRFPERLLLAVCRPVNAPPLAVPTHLYNLENALDYGRRLIPEFPQRLAGKSVLDYGCGPGWQAVSMRQAGASSVHGLDINDEWLDHGRALARSERVNDVTFGKEADREQYDVVISLGAAEHFADPAKELARMCAMARHEVIVSFAEPWFSPYGTHLNGTTKLPWLNLVFSEKTLMNVRNLYPDGRDGAKVFAEMRGGLNKMTVKRFERLVASAPGMKVDYLHLRGVKSLPVVTRLPVMRELMTSAITCILHPRAAASRSEAEARESACSGAKSAGAGE